MTGGSMRFHWKALLVALVPGVLIVSLTAQQRPGAPAQGAAPTGPPTVTFQGREIPNTIEEQLNPKHTVLVVHELLNDFISVGGAQDKNGRRYNADSIIQPVAE